MKMIYAELNPKDYERLKDIVASEHRTIKATITMLVLNYINSKNEE